MVKQWNELTQEELEEAYQKFLAIRRGFRDKKFPVFLVDENTKLGPLMVDMGQELPKLNLDPLDIVRAFEDAKKVGIGELDIWSGDGGTWLVNVDAFKDLNALKEYCKEGLSIDNIQEGDCPNGALAGIMKEDYLEAFQIQLDKQDYDDHDDIGILCDEEVE